MTPDQLRERRHAKDAKVLRDLQRKQLEQMQCEFNEQEAAHALSRVTAKHNTRRIELMTQLAALGLPESVVKHFSPMPTDHNLWMLVESLTAAAIAKAKK